MLLDRRIMAYQDTSLQSTGSRALFEKMLCQSTCLHQRTRVEKAQAHYRSVAFPQLLQRFDIPGSHTLWTDMQRQFGEFLETVNIGKTASGAKRVPTHCSRSIALL
jgi:hypothetical protein